MGLAKGLVIFLEDDGTEYLFSEECTCAECGVNIPEMAPRMFFLQQPLRGVYGVRRPGGGAPDG